MLKQATSVFIVIDYVTNEAWRLSVPAVGDQAARTARNMYGKNAKIVLEGFEVDGSFIALRLEK